MSLRPKPVRVAVLVVAFYVLVYGIVLRRDGAAPIRPRAWRRAAEAARRPIEAIEALPPPVEPRRGDEPVPERFRDLADQLVRPNAREWKWIVMHHSATADGNAASIDKYHREFMKWDGLGYHFVIGNGNGAPLGGVEPGFRWLQQREGAHAGKGTGEYNTIGIGICLVGNYEVGEVPEEIYASLLDLTTWLCRRYGIPPARIVEHKAVRLDPTDCPGRNFPIDRLRRDVQAALK